MGMYEIRFCDLQKESGTQYFNSTLRKVLTQRVNVNVCVYVCVKFCIVLIATQRKMQRMDPFPVLIFPSS